MSKRRVSIVVWRDARDDPPKGNLYRYVYVLAPKAGAPCVRARWVVSEPRRFRAWAEIPVVSDLTDDDVLDAANGAEMAKWPEAADRLRAALGGEKEET